MNDFNAPNEIKAWLECLFWFAGFIAALIYIARMLRGPAAHPPNEVLAISSGELMRRVEHLESENTKVWVKMEMDARSLERKIAEVDKLVSGLTASVESLAVNCNLLKISVDNFPRRR